MIAILYPWIFNKGLSSFPLPELVSLVAWNSRSIRIMDSYLVTIFTLLDLVSEVVRNLKSKRILESSSKDFISSPRVGFLSGMDFEVKIESYTTH
jgi:hypothetical protein